MPYAESWSTIQQEISQLRDTFAAFKRQREDVWAPLVRRQLPAILPPELKSVQEGLDYEMPDLARAKADYTAILQINPTDFAIAVYDHRERQKKYGSDILLWSAAAWYVLNTGRWWDRKVGEGEVTEGLKIMALRWTPQDMPEKADEASREHFYRQRRLPFFWEDVRTTACYWLETRGEPNVFYYEYERFVLEAAQSTYSREGKKLRPSVDTAGRLSWLGEAEIPEKSATQKRLQFLVRDSPTEEDCPLEGCDHKMRSICYLIKGEGNKDEEWEEIEKFNSPFPGCSFFVISSGPNNESDPHEKHRPLMEDLYVEVQWVNFLITLLAVQAKGELTNADLYMPLDHASPEALSWWSARVDEAGGSPTQVDLNKVTPGSIPVTPATFQRIPRPSSEHLMALIQIHLARVRSLMPNRLLTGAALEEATEATGTAFLQQAQTATVPLNPLLASSDAAISKAFEYMYHAIRYWQYESASDYQVPYYLPISDRVNVVGVSPKMGDVVYITAEKLETDFQLLIETKAETLAEQTARWLDAKDKARSGIYTVEQLIKAAGIRDVEGQKGKLALARLRRLAAPFVENLQLLELKRMFEAEMGISLGTETDVAARPPGPPGPPVGPPAGNGATTLNPIPVMGRAVQPGVVQGPAGGASPLGGTVG